MMPLNAGQIYLLGGALYLAIGLPWFVRRTYLAKTINDTSVFGVAIGSLIWPITALILIGLYQADKQLTAEREERKRLREVRAAEKYVAALDAAPLALPPKKKSSSKRRRG